MRTQHLDAAQNTLSRGRTVIPIDVQVAVFMPPSLSLATTAVASCPACCPKQLKGPFLSQHERNGKVEELAAAQPAQHSPSGVVPPPHLGWPETCPWESRAGQATKCRTNT